MTSKPTTPQQARAIELFSSGSSARDVAEALGVHERTARSSRRRFGAEIVARMEPAARRLAYATPGAIATLEAAAAERSPRSGSPTASAIVTAGILAQLAARHEEAEARSAPAGAWSSST